VTPQLRPCSAHSPVSMLLHASSTSSWGTAVTMRLALAPLTAMVRRAGMMSAGDGKVVLLRGCGGSWDVEPPWYGVSLSLLLVGGVGKW
jgi:hypothetical protein